MDFASIWLIWKEIVQIRIYSKFEYENERIRHIRIVKRPIFVGRSIYGSEKLGFAHGLEKLVFARAAARLPEFSLLRGLPNKGLQGAIFFQKEGSKHICIQINLIYCVLIITEHSGLL